MERTDSRAEVGKVPRAYALRNTATEATERLLREWETAELTLTYLMHLLCKPQRLGLVKELVREIEDIQRRDGAPEWQRVKQRLEAQIKSPR